MARKLDMHYKVSVGSAAATKQIIIDSKRSDNLSVKALART